MVAIHAATLDVASQKDDLRWRVGVVVAMAWMLAQLWHASPLPYLLATEAGPLEIIPYRDFHWAHLAFATASAFLLFPSRVIRPAWVNVFLSAISALIVTYPLWVRALRLTRHLNMESLTWEILPLEFVLAAAAMLVAIAMAGRIFGRLGALLAIIALFPPSFLAGFGDSVSFTAPALRAELTDLLQGLVYLYRQFGSVAPQLSADFFFLFVAIGVGLDHMGWGQKIAGASTQVLKRYARQRAGFISEILGQRTFAASFTLAMVVYFQGEIGGTAVDGAQALGLLGIGAGLYLTCFVVSVVWAGRQAGALPSRASFYRRMLGALHWSALVAVVAAVIFGLTGQVIEVLGGRGSLSISGLAAPMIFVALALVACAAASGFRTPRVAGALRIGCAAIPVISVNWLMTVEGGSPALASFWSVPVLLLCVLGWRTSGSDTGTRPAAVSRFLTSDLPGLCVSTAQFMAGIALVAAFYWLIALWWFEVLGTRIM